MSTFKFLDDLLESWTPANTLSVGSEPTSYAVHYRLRGIPACLLSGRQLFKNIF